MASGSRLRVSRPTEKAQEMDPVSSTASKASNAGRPALLSFDEMPDWFQRESNKWILHGYRPISGSIQTSFRSWTYVHNESVNIYSHLIPAIVFLLGEWYILQYLTSKHPGVTGADFTAFSIFMLAAVTCLSLSATYHTLLNHSEHMEHFCLRLDMLGVVIFILGDLVLGIYMIFWCELLPRNIYWSLVCQLHAHVFVSSHFRLSLGPNTLCPSSDRGLRNDDHFHDIASEVPGGEVPHLSSLDVRGYRHVWCRAFDTRSLRLWHGPNDAQSPSVYDGKSSLPFIWGLFLCSESP